VDKWRRAAPTRTVEFGDIEEAERRRGEQSRAEESRMRE
jgi:hypothetical protein